MNVPVRTSTGIEMGKYYQRPLPNLVQSQDALNIQYALLCKKRPTVAQYLLRMIGL